jgi:murein DD-endopeptidase MepM/ murein hydrolase activator NlpD
MESTARRRRRSGDPQPMPFALVVLLMVAVTVLPAGITRIAPGGWFHPAPPAAARGPALPSPVAGNPDALPGPARWQPILPTAVDQPSARRLDRRPQRDLKRRQATGLPAPFRAPHPTNDPPRTTGGSVPPPLASGGFVWPLDGPPPILRRFDPPPEPWLPGHRGVDLGAAPGSTVRAAGDGTVVFAGMVAGRGVVSIEHPGGLRTTYQPVQVGTATGRAIAAGTPVGTLGTGHPGCPAAACLHWGLRRGTEYLDPLVVLALGRARLLPLTAGP